MFCQNELRDVPRLVSAESGSTTLRVGERMDRWVEIVLSWWLGLKVDKGYKIVLPRAHVGRWECGSMDVVMEPAISLLHLWLMIY